MADLTTTISKIEMTNPTMLAAGVLGETGDSLLAIAKGGAGALVTKSIGREPREGHKNPTFVEVESGLLNAMGLPNPGIEVFKEEAEKALGSGIPVIGSIFTSTAQKFAMLAAKMEEYGVHGVELNLSCPHARGYGAELGHDPKTVEDITRVVKDSVSIPVFVKLSPNVDDIVVIARAVERAQGDGVVAINTIKAMAINPELAMPVLANTTGGLSGPAVKSIGLRCVYEIRTKTDLPVIGVGGITSGRDAVEYIMAGASAVQIGSGIYYRGKEIFKNVCSELEDFMDAHSYNSIEEMVGIAAKRRTG
jgi:dihydroorotate dehydrogenase (NAD+) catalytic subunit